MKVGSTKAKKVDCRVIAATNKDLKRMVKEKTFREDLYYRLSVIPVEIPPLRERREDIIHLILFFLREINEKNGSNKTMSQELLHTLERAEWKGNARQLKNMVERLAVLSVKREITVADMPPEERGEGDIGAVGSSELPVALPQVVEKLEDRYIEKAMKEHGSIRKAAALLGISPTTLFRKINRKE